MIDSTSTHKARMDGEMPQEWMGRIKKTRALEPGTLTNGEKRSTQHRAGGKATREGGEVTGTGGGSQM